MTTGELLRAAGMTLTFTPELGLRDLAIDSRPLLDAVYCAVRDTGWGTAPVAVESWRVRAMADGFEAVATTRHRGDEVDVRWSMRVVGDADGVTLEVDGEALREQRVRRAGLALLHPLAHRGAAVVTRIADGRIRSAAFAAAVDPDPLFTDVVAMSVALPEGGHLELVMDGEVFETEDHRNWMDAGWKTYCTPLDRPSPRRLAAGDRIRQSVSMRVRDRPTGVGQQIAVDRLEIDDPIGAVPSIGAFDGVGRQPWAHRAVAGEIHGLHHPGAPVRLTLALRDEDVSAAQRAIERWAAPPISIALVDPDSRVTEQALLDAWRRRDDDVGRLVIGTDAHLAELNRAALPACSSGAVQLGIDPHVHHVDTALVLDGARALPDMVAHAVGIAAGRGLHLSPLRLPSRLAAETGADASAAWAIRLLAGLARVDVVSLAPPVRGTAAGAVDVLGGLAPLGGAPIHAVRAPEGVVAAAVAHPDGGRQVLVASTQPHPQRVRTAWSLRPLHLAPYAWRRLHVR